MNAETVEEHLLGRIGSLVTSYEKALLRTTLRYEAQIQELKRVVAEKDAALGLKEAWEQDGSSQMPLF